jgi:hypothetical protein
VTKRPETKECTETRERERELKEAKEFRENG